MEIGVVVGRWLEGETYTRGVVEILNRQRLEPSACDCYRVIQRLNDELGLTGGGSRRQRFADRPHFFSQTATCGKRVTRHDLSHQFSHGILRLVSQDPLRVA